MVYDSFTKFMEESVLPQKRDKPQDERLDGQPTGGNRAVFGRFHYNGEEWRVHADTHYEPLLIAYRAITDGRTHDPFVIKPTRSGKGRCLDLKSELLTQREGRFRSKHLYIYADGSGN